MVISKINLVRRLGSLSRRERSILLLLFLLVFFYAGEYLVSRLFLEPHRTLAREVALAEQKVLDNERLLSREELIHTEFKKLDGPLASVRDSVRTESGVLRELAELAGRRIQVKSVVPRLGFHEGREVMFVAMDFEGPFEPVVEYVEAMLSEMPSAVDNLSLAPRSGDDDGVVCRLSLRVDCF